MKVPDGMIRGIIPKYRVQESIYRRYAEYFGDFDKSLAEQNHFYQDNIRFSEDQKELLDVWLDDFTDAIIQDLVNYNDDDCADCPLKFDYEKKFFEKRLKERD